jgi:hypothetical protein
LNKVKAVKPTRGRAVAARAAHNRQDVGSSPTPATNPPGPKPVEMVATLKERLLEAYIQTRRLDMAAKMVGISPTTPYRWKAQDSQFKEDLEACYEVIGDHYLGKLETQAEKNIIGHMFLVKRYKPEFRDKVESVQVNTEIRLAIGLIQELRQAGPVAVLEGGQE